MPISKEKKKEILGKLKTVAGAVSLAFVNFHGLTVGNATEIRRKLKESGVSYLVAKKTLVKKALNEAGISGTLPELAGELGIAYLSAEARSRSGDAKVDGEDLLAPAREVFAFQKKFENRISLLGGVFEGKFIGAEEVKALAIIPSRDTLYAQFVNLINSPLQGLVMVLDGIAKTRITN